MINILVRTSDRPNYFNECIESIRMQHYEKYRIIVGNDNDDSYCDHFRPVKLIKQERKDTRIQTAIHFPYNLYFNELYKHVKTGYVLCLDDDDCLTRPDSLQIIANHLSPDMAVFWKVNCNGRLIPSDENWQKHPVCKDFSTIGMCFPAKYIPMLQWDEFKQCDYRIGSRLFDLMPVRWIDEVLTRTQDGQHSGMKIDRKASHKKIVMICPVWKRHSIFKKFVKSFIEFKKAAPHKVSIEMVCVLSPEDPEYLNHCELLNKHKIKYVVYTNFPVSRKMNALVNYVYQNYEFDYLMNIGSDDLINSKLWELYKPFIIAEEKYFGLNQFYCYDKKQNLSCLFRMDDMIVGGGRMIHYSILKEVLRHGNLYPEKSDSGLDSESNEIIYKFTGFKGHIIESNEPYILDLKTEVNINAIEFLIHSTLGTEIDFEIIKHYFDGNL